MKQRKNGRIIRRAKPKTWDHEKHGNNSLPKLGNMPHAKAVDLIERLSKATGWSQQWFMDKEDEVLLRLANKYLG